MNSYILQEPNNHLNIDEIPGLELSQEKQNRVNENLYNIINKKCSSNHINKQIHCIFYCINVSGNRIDRYEIEWLKELNHSLRNFNVPIIVVLTQSLEKINAENIKTIIEDELDFVTVVPVLAQPLEIDDVYKIKCYGLDNLYETVVEKFPYEIKNSKEDCQLINLELMKSYSSFVVSMVTLFNILGIFIFPYPFLYLLLSLISHISMIEIIKYLFNFKFYKNPKLIIFSIIDIICSSSILFIIFILFFIINVPFALVTTEIINTILLGTFYIKIMIMINMKEINEKMLYNYNERINIISIIINKIKNKNKYYEILLQ